MTDEQRINDYVRRLGWSLQRLDPVERRSLTEEIRSHLTDSAAAGPGSLDRALAGFDTPYALGRRFVEEYQLAGAVAECSPRYLLTALLGRSTRRLLATAAAFAGILCYLFALTFVAIGVTKPFLPTHVGAWRSGGAWEAGILSSAPASPELLGLWAVPLSLSLAIVSYMAGTTILRQTGRRLLR